MRSWIPVILSVAFFATTGQAHQPGLSTLFVELRSNTVAVEMIVAWQELESVTPLDANRDRELSESEVASAQSNLLSLTETAVSLESDGRPLQLSGKSAWRDDTTGIRFTMQFDFPPTRVLLVRSDILDEFPRGHKQIIVVRDAAGKTLSEWVLERDRNMLEVPLNLAASVEQPINSARQFLWLGVEHIVMGWDHLLFLFSLLVVGGTLRDAVKIITSFTIAHSLTLALATFDMIRLPSSIVEPLIAASIVYVGIENIARDNYRGRWALTFVFGLIHGCGFATMLRDLGVGTNGGSVVKPLVCFNVGVELGQLAIAAVMLPIIWKLKPRFPARWIPVTSFAAILVGGYWLIERTLLS
jgi:hydrogenase/urease accessory protein HupE